MNRGEALEQAFKKASYYADRREECEAFLASLRENGFAVVPVASTPEMERAGANTFGGQGEDVHARYEVSVMYRAMVAAATSPKASSEPPVNAD